jgi:hypothetical protein
MMTHAQRVADKERCGSLYHFITYTVSNYDSTLCTSCLRHITVRQVSDPWELLHAALDVAESVLVSHRKCIALFGLQYLVAYH